MPVLDAIRRTLFGAMLWITAMASQAQVDERVVLLSQDLCGCIEAIDEHGTDAQLTASVRSCLEDAVVYHPAAVNALLRGADERGSKAYNLGRHMGLLLERDCPGYVAIKARLQHAAPNGSLKKPSL
jgi:hypothetical protein